MTDQPKFDVTVPGGLSEEQLKACETRSPATSIKFNSWEDHTGAMAREIRRCWRIMSVVRERTEADMDTLRGMDD